MSQKLYQNHESEDPTKPADETPGEGKDEEKPVEKSVADTATDTADQQQSDPLKKKPAKKQGSKRDNRQRKKRPKESSGNTDSPDDTDQAEEKPKRTPQLHTDDEIRGMLAALQADYPGMSFKDIVKYALRLWSDKIAYTPPIHLRRLKAETLRTMAGYAAEAERRAEVTTRKIIKSRMNPDVEAKLTDELQTEVTGFGEMRRNMMRQAAIPMTPNLPDDVSVGIVILEHEKLECPDESRQVECDTCIQILKAYQPPEYDLPADLRDPLAEDHSN
jgi:hypothetical protein